MLIVAQQFTRESVQKAFDEAAEYRGHQWAIDELERAVGVRKIDDVPEAKFMNAVAAFSGYTVGVLKPTTGATITCKSRKRSPAEAMNEMAGRIYGQRASTDGKR